MALHDKYAEKYKSSQQSIEIKEEEIEITDFYNKVRVLLTYINNFILVSVEGFILFHISLRLSDIWSNGMIRYVVLYHVTFFLKIQNFTKNNYVLKCVEMCYKHLLYEITLRYNVHNRFGQKTTYVHMPRDYLKPLYYLAI